MKGKRGLGLCETEAGGDEEGAPLPCRRGGSGGGGKGDESGGTGGVEQLRKSIPNPEEVQGGRRLLLRLSIWLSETL